jgi:hypothetical protein
LSIGQAYLKNEYLRLTARPYLPIFLPPASDVGFGEL